MPSRSKEVNKVKSWLAEGEDDPSSLDSPYDSDADDMAPSRSNAASSSSPLPDPQAGWDQFLTEAHQSITSSSTKRRIDAWSYIGQVVQQDEQGE